MHDFRNTLSYSHSEVELPISISIRPLGKPLLIECDPTREGLSLAVEVLIAALDRLDGDSDFEPSGDEFDHTKAEDEGFAKEVLNG